MTIAAEDNDEDNDDDHDDDANRRSDDNGDDDHDYDGHCDGVLIQGRLGGAMCMDGESWSVWKQQPFLFFAVNSHDKKSVEERFCFRQRTGVEPAASVQDAEDFCQDKACQRFEAEELDQG